ncbi:GNAT family N-acetyltransferase [Stigmatella aurantiaca]|uniref:acetyltransferase, GNAT family n=1 Tax=Stigmatella aurantiaca (strain DW4/3-1) TaxID=378806 RepID=Q09CA8_STIAD|nr:GNAT family N-acetyltransferase [Stigmatella aurantiaca]ADO69558.1 Acetyltransferase, GNAT family [Stigmatella aurantiaca DW4/3-1]EAU69415.1 acetyltransferase, gnat family [Stigmatella aurantiaca DW4/3-1]
MTQVFERVTTERLLLRAVHDSDVEAVFALHGDPETSRYSVSGPMRSLDAARKQLDVWLGDWSSRGIGYWGVERRDDPGVAVGFGGLRHKVIDGQQVLNLAYRFAPKAWGSGYATELARAALELAREHLPETPVVAVIHPENEASIRVATRLGMRLDRIIDHEGIPSRLYVPA